MEMDRTASEHNKEPVYPYVTPVTDGSRGKSDFYLSMSVGVIAGNSESADEKGEVKMKPSKTVLALKRTLDISAGLAGTAVFLLSYPILALLIKLESRGPALYTQARVGIDKRSGSGRDKDSRRQSDVGGRIFTIRKFRTMRIDAEANGPQLCGKGSDPRVTRIGRLLRASHLDELPQFWNVLRGEMSFIGPRPERPHFTLRYFSEIPKYRERTRFAKPGLTGLSQIVLGYDDSLESVVRKTHFDLAYRASLPSLGAWLRMEGWVIFNTVRYLLHRKPLSEVAGHPRFAGLGIEIPMADGCTVTESLGRPLVAMVRHRGNYSPTIVLAKDRSQAAAPSQPAAPARILPAVSNFFTVDVECWFHAHNLNIPRSQWASSRTRVTENVGRTLDMLAAHKATGTFFVLGWVADRFPEVVRMIDAAGHEIGTHGYHHDKVTDLSPYEFEKDLEMSLTSLAKLTGQKIVGHRASNFSIVNSSLWALEIMKRYGIEYDSSIFPVKRKRYGIPDYPNRLPHVIDLGGGASIREVPLSVADFAGRAWPMSGGGYMRLYPYALTDMYIRRSNRMGRPAMVYFHPWELDLNQTRVKAGLLESFQHYVNLDTTEWKLSRLLERFPFTSVRDNLETENVREMLSRNSLSIKIPRSASEGMIVPNPERPYARNAEKGLMTA